MKKTLELYGTLGPADHSTEILNAMFQAGMTGLRLNLSHTNLEDCEPWLHNLYTVAEKRHIVPDLLVDLQGPEVRIGILKDALFLPADSIARLCPISSMTENNLSSTENNCDTVNPVTQIPAIPIPDAVFPYLKEGQTLRLDDGNIILTVTKIHPALPEVTSKVVAGGLLSSRKSLAIDGVSVELPTLTPQDFENLKVLQKYRVTGVMLPFVRSSEDLINLKKALMDFRLSHIRIFAKIENRQGVEQLSSLLPYCDQIVIARGDLGNAYPLPKLPAVQKQIARTCLAFKKPFMVVTQMLASMTEHPVPTRAEVSDIFNAVLDGASSLMLTGETAAGHYPAEAMRVLSDTSFEALRYRMESKFFL